MHYVDRTIREYADITAAREPVPGGGSVSAVAGALGAALTSMVCNFTAGNPKYTEYEAESSEILSRAEELRRTLLELADKDVEVYSDVTSAYKLPRATAEDKAARQRAIQEALTHAAAVPLAIARASREVVLLAQRAIARASREVVLLAQRLVDIGNTNLISDVGVAVLMAEAGLRGAALNVEINSASIKDAQTADGLREFLAQALPEVREVTEEVMSKALAKIRD